MNLRENGEEYNEWRIARNRRQNSKRKPNYGRRGYIRENNPPDENDPSGHPIHKIVPRMLKNEWYKSTLIKINHVMGERTSVQALICLGMGSMSTQKNARHQFACAVNLAEAYKPRDVIVYDPIMDHEDKQLVSSFGWINAKNEVDFFLNDDEVVLLFMPHCHRGLVQRVIKELRSRGLLSNVVFLGNSITRDKEKILGFNPELENWYIDILLSTDTVQLNCGRGLDSTHERAFNDLAVTTFAAI